MNRSRKRELAPPQDSGTELLSIRLAFMSTETLNGTKLKPKDVAARWGCKVDKVRALINSDQLRASDTTP